MLSSASFCICYVASSNGSILANWVTMLWCIHGTSSYIARVADDNKLKYVDKQLSFVYVGCQICHNGIRRSSVIFFHCNQTAGNTTVHLTLLL